jgi:hypothetical protein
MGMECVLLETVRYGMTFLLFHLQDIEGKKWDKITRDYETKTSLGKWKTWAL